MFTCKVKSVFDAQKVLAEAEKGNRRAMARFAAYLRGFVRRSMRRSKQIAPPGKPPAVHTGGLRNLIFFAYDPSSRSEVIGPISDKHPEVPHKLEFGRNPYMAPALEALSGQLPGYWANSVR